MNDVSNRLIWGISSKMWDCGTNCQNVGQMWDKIAKCGKCGNVGRLYSLGLVQNEESKVQKLKLGKKQLIANEPTLRM